MCVWAELRRVVFENSVRYLKIVGVGSAVIRQFISCGQLVHYQSQTPDITFVGIVVVADRQSFGTPVSSTAYI